MTQLRTAIALPRWPTSLKPFPQNLLDLDVSHVVEDDGDGPLDAERRTLERLTVEWTRELEAVGARTDLTGEGQRRYLNDKLPKFRAVIDDLSRRLEAKRTELRDRQARMRAPRMSAGASSDTGDRIIAELRRQEIRRELSKLEALRRYDVVRTAAVAGDLEICNAVLDAPRVFSDLVDASLLSDVQAAVHPEHAKAVQALEERIPLFQVALLEVSRWLEASANYTPEDLRAAAQAAERNARVQITAGALG